MVNNICDLSKNGVLKDANGNATSRLCSQLCINPFRTITANDPEGVSGLETKRDQSQGKITNMLQILLPGHGLPDTEFLFTEGHPGVPEPPGMSNQERRKGLGNIFRIGFFSVHFPLES